MCKRLTLTQDQFDESMRMLAAHELFDPVLLDERTPDGEIVTVLEYDSESIMLQIINNEGFDYNIIPRAEFISGARVQS